MNPYAYCKTTELAGSQNLTKHSRLRKSYKTMCVRRVPGTFYRERTLEWVWGYSPVLRSGVKPVAENGLREFQRSKNALKTGNQTLLAAFFLPEIKLNTVKPVLSGHSRDDRLSFNECQKYCRMLQWEHSAILSTFI